MYKSDARTDEQVAVSSRGGASKKLRSLLSARRLGVYLLGPSAPPSTARCVSMDARSPPAAVDLVDYKMALVPPARKAAEQQEVHLEAAAAALIADYVSGLRDSRSSEKYV